MKVNKEDGVLLLRADNTYSEYEGELESETLHELLGCELLEFAQSIDGGTLVTDESGKMKNKRVNFRATYLYKYAFTKKGKPIDMIVGDVLYLPRKIAVAWDAEDAEEEAGEVLDERMIRMVVDIQNGDLSAEEIADKYTSSAVNGYRQAIIDLINKFRSKLNANKNP